MPCVYFETPPTVRQLRREVKAELKKLEIELAEAERESMEEEERSEREIIPLEMDGGKHTGLNHRTTIPTAEKVEVTDKR